MPLKIYLNPEPNLDSAAVRVETGSFLQFKVPLEEFSNFYLLNQPMKPQLTKKGPG